MKATFWLLGFVLIGVLLVWIAYSFATVPLSVAVQEPGGPRAMGSPGMPDKAMEEAVRNATAVMKSGYQNSHRYRWWSRFADWIGFLLTAAITVIVGSTGQTLQGAPPGQVPAGAVPPEAANLGRRWLRRIGVMAALASAMIAVSSRFAATSQEYLDMGEKLRIVIIKSREDYNGAATPTEGENVVNNLVAETAKYQPQ